MNLKSGQPYSLIHYGRLANYPVLSKNIRTDVLVIGAGISGALLAWHLARKNINTVVVDARIAGMGSTCASSSLLLYELDTPLCQLEKIFSRSQAELAYRISAASIHKLLSVAKKIGFSDIQNKESIYYATKKNDSSLLKRECRARQKIGIQVEYLEGKDLFQKTGIKAPSALVSALAAQTDAYAFTHALLKDCSKNGVRIYDESKVVSIEHQRKKHKVIMKNGNIIHAGKIVYATGYETINYIDQPRVDIRSTFVTISKSIPDQVRLWPEERLIWNTADPYLYIRTTSDRRILVGGRDEKFYSPAKRNKLILSKSKELAKDFHGLFNGIDFEPEFSWTGSFVSTRDGLPYIGPYHKLPDSFFALGFGGNGITLSIIAAEIITAMILGKKPKHAAVFSFER